MTLTSPSRLLTDGPESLETYRARGGYAVMPDAPDFIDQVEAAGLRGRGGAAFPTAYKLRTLAASADAVLVANGEEGEPMSVKDKWLLRNRPHLVLDGVRLAAAAIGSREAYVYVSDEEARVSVEAAIAEASEAELASLDLTLVAVASTYVAGEETAAVRAINGGPALPMDKPPRPFEEGVAGRPTLISNVETLANLPSIAAGAPADSVLATLTVDGRGGLYEVPLGITVRDAFTIAGLDTTDVTGLVVGGYFSGVATPQFLDVVLDYDTIRAAGFGLGCGAIGAFTAVACPVDVAAAVMAYFSVENAGQCGSCFNGTGAMAAVLGALRDQVAEDGDVERLRGWSTALRGRGACGTLDGATNVAATILSQFPAAIESHLARTCTTCASGARIAQPPFGFTLENDTTGVLA